MPADQIMDGFEKLLSFANEHGRDEATRVLVSAAEGEALSLRRKTALFAAAFRGHCISTLDEQAYGYVGQCANCDMLLKVPRDPAKGEPVLGRVVEFDCPATGQRDGGDHGSQEG